VRVLKLVVLKKVGFHQSNCIRVKFTGRIKFFVDLKVRKISKKS